MQNLTQFLKINGKLIWFTDVEGITYIAVKPICEALGIHFNKQFEKIKSHPLLKAAYTNQYMQVPGDQARKYFCLREEKIYGWIFSIQSEQPELIQYQEKVYDILFNHFRGTITERAHLLKQKAELMAQREQLETVLAANPEYKTLCNIKASEMRLAKDLIKLDEQMMDGKQLSIEF